MPEIPDVVPPQVGRYKFPMANQMARRALVTGASSGMGAALGRRLAARGIEVWLAARRADLLAEQVRLIEAAGGRAHALALDVGNLDATVERLERLDDEVGGIDIVVANAGIGGAKGAIPMSRCPWPDVRDMFQINLMGAVATVTPFIPRMLKRGHGQIVGVSSLGADLPLPQAAPYGASKAGLTFFLESIDIELRGRGVAVTVVHPGFVRTAMLADLATVEARQPFSVSDEEAARIIDRAMLRRARIVRFPWILSVANWVVRKLPRAVTDPIMRLTMARALAPRPPLKVLPRS